MYSLVYYENETFYKKAFTVQTMIVFLLQLKQLSQITVNASGSIKLYFSIICSCTTIIDLLLKPNRYLSQPRLIQFAYE